MKNDVQFNIAGFMKLLSTGGRQLRKWLMTDTNSKVGVLIFTILLWFFIILGNEFTYTFSVPLEVHNIEEGKTLKQKLPAKVQASFSGRGIDLLYLMFSRGNSFRFVVDLQNIRWFYNFALNEYFQNNPEKIITPRGTDAQFSEVIFPDTLTIELDVLTTRKLPVVPAIEIQPAAGYILDGAPRVFPDSVVLSGPQFYVNYYNVVGTEPLQLQNLAARFDREMRLDLKESENIAVSHDRVRVIQELDQISEKTLSGIPIKITGVPARTRVEIVPSDYVLLVTGGVRRLKQLTPDDFEIYFDYSSQWKAGQQYYAPLMKLPDGIIGVRRVTPEQCEVRVFRER